MSTCETYLHSQLKVMLNPCNERIYMYMKYDLRKTKERVSSLGEVWVIYRERWVSFCRVLLCLLALPYTELVGVN